MQESGKENEIEITTQPTQLETEDGTAISTATVAVPPPTIPAVALEETLQPATVLPQTSTCCYFFHNNIFFH